MMRKAFCAVFLLFQIVQAQVEENEIVLDDGMSVPVGVDSAADAAKLKCPKYLDSVTAVDADTWFFFKDYSVYRIQSQKIVGQPVRIKEMFPRGPDFINATVTSNGLTLLFAERTIYGYEYENGRFSEAEGFPRELHERVLFFPQAAFPLSNGSVVLLSGNVFATYNVLENVPSILNDKNRVFPNLPYDLRSGIPVHPNDYSKYYMFDETTVAGWNSITHQADEPQPITEFFKCDN